MNRFRADLVLLTVALIWGSAFAVQRVAARYFDTYTFNGLRFLLGGFLLLPFSRLNPWNRRKGSSTAKSKAASKNSTILDRKSIFFILSAGTVLFGGSALQQAGLKYTTAGNAAFITTLYIVLVPVILVAVLREKIYWIAWLGAAIAISGSLLLSTGGSLHLARGDDLEMIASLMWALDVILVSRAVQHVDILTFAVGHYLVAGMLNMLISVWMPTPLAGIGRGWWTIVYIGVLSTAIGYTFQALGQKYAPPTDATILLGMESIFAALAGFIFLGERKSPVQLAGCSMIFVAVVITQLNAVKFRATVVQADEST
jgi:drug/metabolite transporter (DMT)-like permease